MVQIMSDQIAGKRSVWLDINKENMEHANGSTNASANGTDPSPTNPDFNRLTVPAGPGAPSWRATLSSSTLSPLHALYTASNEGLSTIYKRGEGPKDPHVRSVSMGPPTERLSPPAPKTRSTFNPVPFSLAPPPTRNPTPMPLNAEARSFTSGMTDLAASQPTIHIIEPTNVIEQQPFPGANSETARPISSNATTGAKPTHSSKPSASGVIPIPEPPPDPELMVWKKEFLAFFGAIKGFCKHYFSDSYGKDVGLHIHTNHRQLMADMAEALQPGGNSVGFSHVTHLLRDPNERPLLIMRMLVQHLLEGTFGKTTWSGYDKTIDEELGRIRSDLLKTHQPALRKALLEQRGNLIYKMKNNTHQWQAFRHNVVTSLSQRARPMFLPFLPTGNSPPIRDEAGYDFRNSVETIVDLAFRAMEHRQDFSFTFAGCRTGEHFIATRHKANMEGMDDERIEAEGYRLKLVMTPVISARVSREMVLIPQTVCKATVVILR